MPRKCQGKKEKCEERKGVGQLKNEGKEERWRGRERIIWSAPKMDKS